MLTNVTELNIKQTVSHHPEIIKLKGTVDVTSIGSQFIEWVVRFSTV